MHTWTLATATTAETGTTDTTRQAWIAVLDAAAHLIGAGHREPLTMTVDGTPAHLQPQYADINDPGADIDATLQALDGMRTSILADQ